MNITKIISIPGLSGLYKMVAQTKNNGIILESLVDKKRIPAYATQKMIKLDDVGIYTTGEDIALKDVLQKIYEMEKGGECISHKEADDKLKAYFKSMLPEYDEERVHTSVIKKVLSWYNILKVSGLLDETEETITEGDKLKIKASEEKVSAIKAPKKKVANKPLKTAGSKVGTKGVRKTGVA